MGDQRVNGHTVSRLTVHIVWSTKYRFGVLTGDIQRRCRSILIQVCDVEGVQILKGVVSKDHVHMHLEYRPSQSISGLVKKLKGRSSRKLQEEFPSLKKRYWGRHFWAIGFGCWSTGNITDEMVNEYLEHHRTSDNDSDAFILE
ncbi:IS200/IS605 family transposase [Sinomicrobium pectinilyticum]|uniref:IS200/IS605 family transposase n=1 Tax=Sinomicrobium pectinilyticum TaxID=1084421 RepID=A0A3N0D2T6_SINP1|nr:IS200/IS605 family transposase [Sinomicrobium pectinilyticum]RNL69975.1 IS200/IS605 family transposase [Sinomicrobium pectinilyticum]